MLVVVLVLALGAVVAQLVNLQAVGARHYEALGLRQRIRTVTLPAERGSIFDRNGHELAMSVPGNTVYADPRVVTDPGGYARALAPVVGRDARTLAARLTQPRSFVYLARNVDDGVAARVRALRLPGVGLVPESRRSYPAATVAAPVLGRTGVDDQGLAGVETAFDGELRGRPGRRVDEIDPEGREIPATQRRDRPAVRGRDLVLTVDEALQFETERRLAQQVQAVGAKGGMAIVEDVRTGDVLAMATVDGGGAGQPARPAPATEQNRTLTTVYEPGSTNKVITIASALELGLVKPTTVLTVPDSLRIADATFEDHDPHGVQQWSVTDIMRQSSNVGAILVGRAVGKDRLDQFLRAFGFGARTAIRFPGESPGLLLPPSRYSATSMGSVPIGNGLAVTAMQMLDVFTTIADRGVARPPRLVRATIDAGGHRQDRPVVAGRRVVSEPTAQAVTSMLTEVVRSGTGTGAAIPGYTVAGKTGTARKPPYEHPPYHYMASFAGFSPAESPRLAAIVVLDDPSTQIYGGQVAAPVFSSIMRYALGLQGVPPSNALVAPAPSAPAEPVSNDALPPATPPSSSGAPTTITPVGAVAAPAATARLAGNVAPPPTR